MESLQKILKEAHVPELVDLLIEGEECWLVGGALRDWVLGRAFSDFDFATHFDPTPLARRFAHAIGGSWFPLDPQRQQSRVISGKGRATTYDFAPFRGPDIESDLRGRDFTLNALALQLGGGRSQTIFDPLDGRKDLSEQRLSACSAGAFRDDPLRILRGVRHAVGLDFNFDQSTADWIREAVHLLPHVAPERIRSELSQILAAPVSRTIALLQDFVLLTELFGHPANGEATDEGVRLASAVEAALETMGSIEPEIGCLCAETLDDGFSRSTLIKLAGFLRCYAPNERRMLLAERLRLSHRNRERLQRLLALPATLAREFEKLPAGRPRALWTEGLGVAAVEILLFLFCLDGTLAARPHLLLNALQDLRTEGGGGGRIPSLVNGAWLQEQLGVDEGPTMGILLEELRRAEIAGLVQSRSDAEAFLLEKRKKS